MIELFLTLLERLGIIVTIAFVLTRFRFFREMIYKKKLGRIQQICCSPNYRETVNEDEEKVNILGKDVVPFKIKLLLGIIFTGAVLAYFSTSKRVHESNRAPLLTGS